VITLMLVQDFIPFPSRTQFLGFVRASYLALFPKLIDQRQFNRRARALRLLVEQSRRYGIRRKGWHLGTQYPLDTKPVSLVGYKRNKSHSDFAGSAGYGVRVSRNFKYFGYKRVTVTTLKGIPIIYDLVPVNADERKAAEAVIDPSSSCDFFADKGFLGLQRQTKIFDQTNHLIWTLSCWPINARYFTRCKTERLLANTIVGLCTHVIMKWTSHLLRHLLRMDFNVNVQTF